MTDPTISAILRLCGALKNPQDPERQADLAMLAQAAMGKVAPHPHWVRHKDEAPPDVVPTGHILVSRDADGIPSAWPYGCQSQPSEFGYGDRKVYTQWILIPVPSL